ncbi:MAG: hypothetical protein ACXVHL_37210, partial [Solirubrobacteraceae bacterium]
PPREGRNGAGTYLEGISSEEIIGAVHGRKTRRATVSNPDVALLSSPTSSRLARCRVTAALPLERPPAATMRCCNRRTPSSAVGRRQVLLCVCHEYLGRVADFPSRARG